jgi:hypothetical protein
MDQNTMYVMGGVILLLVIGFIIFRNATTIKARLKGPGGIEAEFEAITPTPPPLPEAVIPRTLEQHPVVPCTTAVINQIPPPSHDFTGREDELGELIAHVSLGGVTISGVRGMGGIGTRPRR